MRCGAQPEPQTRKPAQTFRPPPHRRKHDRRRPAAPVRFSLELTAFTRRPYCDGPFLHHQVSIFKRTSFVSRSRYSVLFSRTVNSRISVPMPTPSAPYNPPRGSPITLSNSPGRFRASCFQWSDLTATIFAPPSPRLHSRCRGGQLPRPLCTHVVPLLLRVHTASASGSPSPHAAGRHLAAQTGGLLLR